MKKFGRTIWVGILAVLAFIVGCVSHKEVAKNDNGAEQERAKLIKERDSIQKIITLREHSCVYGSPEVIREYGAETRRLREKVEDINKRLNENEPK